MYNIGITMNSIVVANRGTFDNGDGIRQFTGQTSTLLTCNRLPKK